MTSHTARRLVVIVGAFMAALTAACGSEQQPQQQPEGLTGGPVGTRDLPGVGTVLVDTAGKTLYFTDSDSAGMIKCTAECTKLWVPAAAPSQDPQTADLGVVRRPEGMNQLTFQSKPLYTFTLDTMDKPASGNNAKDSFAGVDFTWHAVVVKASGQAPTETSGGGYGGGQDSGGY